MKRYLLPVSLLLFLSGSSLTASEPCQLSASLSNVLNSVSVSTTAGETATVDADHLKIYSGNLLAYPWQNETPPAQTPPPAGYAPVHLEHYGRHGSRWLIGGNDYEIPVEKLEKAEKAGKLTPLGVKTLALLKNIKDASQKRHGELSDNGAIQHQGIGRRMARNYPELFNDSSFIDAKSTVVIRCILSMLNGLQGIREIAPHAPIKTDASYADMYFMNYDDKPAWKVKDHADTTDLKKYREEFTQTGDYLSRLITDEQFARDSIAPGLMPYLYWVLVNAQSHSDQPQLALEVFSPEDLKAAWRYDNAYWIIHSANTPMTRNRMPYTQRMLLKNIIESTDTALLSGHPSVNLRYGHDGILINLLVLLDINNLGKEFATIQEAEAGGIRSYELIPMAANLQLLFYAPTHGNTDESPMLVKALLNEREVRLPGIPVSGPYYRWDEIRNHWLNKLARFKSDDE